MTIIKSGPGLTAPKKATKAMVINSPKYSMAVMLIDLAGFVKGCFVIMGAEFMQKTCKQCSANFEVTEDDLKFYDKVSPIFCGKKYSIPAPTLCPDCRRQRRLAHRNELTLYSGNCSFSGKKILSMYPEDVPFPVYAPEAWFSDKWNAKAYAKDFDFSRPFFEQYIELRNSVPHFSLVLDIRDENCDFCNIVGSSKNCYLCFGSIECEDCYYGNPFRCKRCVDSLLLRDSELCLQCIDSQKLYNCIFCQNCVNSRDLKFCYAVQNSQNCFGCVNLNHKQYCVFNKQYSLAEYNKVVSAIDLTDQEQFDSAMSQFEDLKNSLPRRYLQGVNNENVTGDYVSNSKNCFESYHVDKCEDIKFAYQMMNAKDCMDVCNGEYGELMYEESAFFDRVHRAIFSFFVWSGIYDVIYCGNCTQDVKNCFGCEGLRHAQYCVLNKQYTKEEYEELVPKIIEHMKKMREWGEFFPVETSRFAYNETVAYQYYPLKKEEVLNRGWRWRDEEFARIADDESTICEVSKKPFKIIPQEKKFYEKRGVILPKRSPFQRHLDRMAMRNPMKIWERKCDKCDKEISTTFAPERKERVYCEECYLKEVY